MSRGCVDGVRRASDHSTFTMLVNNEHYMAPIYHQNNYLSLLNPIDVVNREYMER